MAGSFRKNFFIVISIKTAKYLVRKFKIVEAQISITLFTHNFNDLHEIRFKNPNSLIFAIISINFVISKSEMFQEVIGNNIDVLLVSEKKLDASYPSSQFILDGFTPPYKLDRTQHGGAKMFFIREGIPSKLLNADTSISGIEKLLVEINLSVRYGIETASSVGARVWSSLPSELKQCKSLELFKARIKNWIPENCPCKLCKTYLHRIFVLFYFFDY